MTTLTFAAAAVVSWLIRVSFILGVPAGHLPAWVQRSFDHAASAAMAALLATSLVHSSGGVTSIGWPAVAATVISGAVAWRTRRLGLTIAVAVTVLFGLESIAS
ncbi:MAG: AzlD domain-containing protein [Jiangellaceae bacterium]